MLEANDLSVFYGRHRALETVTIRVDRGEICVILGANGAGKSTLLKALAGLIRSEAGGHVAVNGVAIHAMKPSQIVEHGIALVPEADAIFGELTVGENLQLGAYPARARQNEPANLKRVYELFPVLSARRRQVARTMSGGEQKMLAIGRALMSEPDILMLDEPSLGLSPLLSTELFKALQAIGKAGVGILLVEQNAKQSLQIADRGYLLENGHIVGEDSAMALASDPAVRRAYLGESTAEPPLPTRVEMQPPVSLAGMSAAEIGGHAAELAARAASIHAAYTQRGRGSGATPGISARQPSVTVAPNVADGAPPASDLTSMAAALAERAGEIHAAHIRSLRQPPPPAGGTAPTPLKLNGGSTPPSTEPAADASALTQMAEEMARRAAEPRPRLNGGSDGGPPAGISEELPAARQGNGAEPSAAARALSRSAGELAARAAVLEARFLAVHRGATQHTLTTHDLRSDDIAAAQPKKHKDKKKKSKKSRKRGGKGKGD
jgi:branched-chain amino acid transport system ATP-binding protein